MQTTRTFIAAVVPESLGVKLTRLQSLVAAGVPGIRWSTVSPFHITLAFLGDVDNSELNAVCLAVGQAAKGHPPLELRLEGLGVFPNPQKARTLWVGLTGEGRSPLVDLQKSIATAVGAAGYPPDDQVFQPHITIGRVSRGPRPASELTSALNHYRTWSAGSFTLREVVTFASTLTRDGPVYAPLARAPLAGGKRESAT